jgi:hypothetical protein
MYGWNINEEEVACTRIVKVLLQFKKVFDGFGVFGCPSIRSNLNDCSIKHRIQNSPAVIDSYPSDCLELGGILT